MRGHRSASVTFLESEDGQLLGRLRAYQLVIRCELVEWCTFCLVESGLCGVVCLTVLWIVVKMCGVYGLFTIVSAGLISPKEVSRE